MNKDKSTQATDEIIGRAFKRSLIAVAVLALVVLAAWLIRHSLRQEEVLLEAPAAAPVSVAEEISPPDVVFTITKPFASSRVTSPRSTSIPMAIRTCC